MFPSHVWHFGREAGRLDSARTVLLSGMPILASLAWQPRNNQTWWLRAPKASFLANRVKATWPLHCQVYHTVKSSPVTLQFIRNTYVAIHTAKVYFTYIFGLLPQFVAHIHPNPWNCLNVESGKLSFVMLRRWLLDSTWGWRLVANWDNLGSEVWKLQSPAPL